jgi:hypothetical protein
LDGEGVLTSTSTSVKPVVTKVARNGTVTKAIVGGPNDYRIEYVGVGSGFIATPLPLP